MTGLGLRIEKLDQSGYYLEDLGSAKLVNHYHKFYFYFNISRIESNYKKLITNLYILELKNHSNLNYSLSILKDNCLQIEDELAKFNHRSKRALINALGSAIRYVTGNLDQTDLQEINSNLNILFANQEKVLKQINSYTSFANHITDRYTKDMTIIQENLNTSLRALESLDHKLNNEMLIQYNIHLSQMLLNSIKTIERTITLAFNEITNLEIISNSELQEIINHLNLIYQKEYLIKLDKSHLFKIIEFSKFQIISVKNTITCILYIPILHPNIYAYQKIYPIPNEQNKALFPPAKYRLFGAKNELWTNEHCSRIEDQVLCLNKLNEDDCSLNDLSKCSFILAVIN